MEASGHDVQTSFINFQAVVLQIATPCSETPPLFES